MTFLASSRFLFAAGLMLLPVTAQAAGSAMQVTKPIYPWRTETQKSPDKSEFSHCLVKNMYDNGILLLIAENAAHQRRLAVHFPQDKLNTNEAYDLDWQVDRQTPQPIRAIAAAPRILAIALDDAMTQQIARGNMLFLRGPNDALVFDMLGVGDAVRSLQDCLATNGVHPASVTFKAKTAPAPAAAVRSPAYKPPAPAASAAAPVMPKSVPAADALSPALRQLFTQAGLAPKNVMQVPDSDRKDKPFDLIWTSGPLFIGTKSEPPIPHQALTQAAARFSKALQTICGGDFLAEGGTVEKRGNRYILPAEVACSPRGGDAKADPLTRSTVAAMLLVLDTRALQIHFIEAPEKIGTSAVAARDKLQSQIK